MVVLIGLITWKLLSTSDDEDGAEGEMTEKNQRGLHYIGGFTG